MTFLVAPRVHDLGGFEVRRAVPSIQARSVGPFVFVDHMGPAVFAPGHGIDVRPHPHIGLATVTFLWAGHIDHRDSLGSAQTIGPGDVNWMTAGRGIAHSERMPPEPRATGHAVHGMQTWVALPKSDEEVAPSFHHHPAATLPVTLLMLQVVRDWNRLTGERIGVKPAGGIRSSKDAIKFLVTVAETVGEEWLDPHLFRFGASSLLNDVLLQRQKLATGRYSGPDYVTVD